MNFVSNFSIQQKLYSGFGILLILMTVIVVNTLISLSAVNSQAKKVTVDIQPTLIAATELDKSLQEASASLGFVLLTNNAEHKVHFRKLLSQVSENLTQLMESPIAIKSMEMKEQVMALEKDVNSFLVFESEVIKLSENQLFNYPALNFSRDSLNPLNIEISQILTEMIQSEAEEESNDQRKKLLITLSILKGNWANVIVNLRVYLYLANEDSKGNIDLFLSGTKANIAKVEAFEGELTFEQEDGVETLKDLISQWEVAYLEVINILNGEKARMDAYFIKTELIPKMQSISEKIGSIVQQQAKATETTGNALDNQLQSTDQLVSILLAFSLFIGIGLSWLVSRMIVMPLRLAVVALNDIADGEGDLTQRLIENGRDETAQLSEGFNRFVNKMHVSIKEVSETVKHLSSSTLQMSDAVNHSFTVVEKQKNETHQIAAAVTEMSATTQAVAKNAETAATAAEIAKTETEQGQKIIHSALEGVRLLGDNIGASTEHITALGQEINDIGAVVDLISNIAEQTNLLALNAAIEAARAGEYGRGFAVVADEVRSLADKTRLSTNDIQSKIDTLQLKANDAVKKMEINRESANDVVQSANNANTTLDSISLSVVKISDMTREIATAAEEQSVVAEDVSQRIEEISNLASEVEESSQNILTGSDGIKSLSDNLGDLVGKFKY